MNLYITGYNKLQTFNGTHWKELPTEFVPVFPELNYRYKYGQVVFIPEDDTKVYFLGGAFILPTAPTILTDKIWEYNLLTDELKELNHRIPMGSVTATGIINHGAVGIRIPWEKNERVNYVFHNFYSNSIY